MSGAIEAHHAVVSPPTRETASPVPPIEQNVIAAAMAAERLRYNAERLSALLQAMPRDKGSVDTLLSAVVDGWLEITTAYEAYHTVIECRGQA